VRETVSRSSQRRLFSVQERRSSENLRKTLMKRLGAAP